MKTFASLTANESQHSHIKKYDVNEFTSSERDRSSHMCSVMQVTVCNFIKKELN